MTRVEFVYYTFLASVGLYIIAGMIGIYFGDPFQLTRAYDPDSMPCGGDGLKQYKYAYFPNPDARFLNRVMCVDFCPEANEQGISTQNLKLAPQFSCAPNSLTSTCKQQIDIRNPANTTLLYDTFPYKGTICLPRTLDYYIAMKDAAIPSIWIKVVKDLYTARLVVLAMPWFSYFLCHYLMRLLKRETKFLVWSFTTLVFLSTLFLTMYFARQLQESKTYPQRSDDMAIFKVSENYIEEMTYQPQLRLNTLLAVSFLLASLYAIYYLYFNHDRIDYLCEFFEILERFMKNDHLEEVNAHLNQANAQQNPQQQQEPSQFHMQESIKYWLLAFIFCLYYIFFSELYLLSTFSVVYGTELTPFNHVFFSYISYLALPGLLIVFWFIQTAYGAAYFLIGKSLNRWIEWHIQTSQAAQAQAAYGQAVQGQAIHNQGVAVQAFQVEVNQNQVAQAQQQVGQAQAVQGNAVQQPRAVRFNAEADIEHRARSDLSSVRNLLKDIAYVSLLLVQSPIKFTADFFRDINQGIRYRFLHQIIKYTFCSFCYCYYHLVRDIEEALYVDTALHHDGIQVSFENLRRALQLNNENNEIVIDKFELIRNIADLFILIIKLLVGLMTMFVSSLLLSNISYFSLESYNVQIPAIICGFMGYCIASVYFSIYAIGVQGLGYLYLRQRAKIYWSVHLQGLTRIMESILNMEPPQQNQQQELNQQQMGAQSNAVNQQQGMNQQYRGPQQNAVNQQQGENQHQRHG